MMRSPRLLLALAAGAVGFAAADTYVVVMALPDMMTTAGISVDDLQRATPIVSGFLLGYIGILPLIGKVSDVRGRVPVLVACMVLLAIGSLITAASFDLSSMVAGRFLQGVGGGGLIPPTLALVADLWPAERRGLPLGIVGAVQELGSVIGPLIGALILSFATWPAIFWINLAASLVLAAALMVWRDEEVHDHPFDWIGALLGVAVLGLITLIMLAPDSLRTGLTTGQAFIPVVGSSRWMTPLALTTYGVVVLLAIWLLIAKRPLIDLRAWATTAREVDIWGAVALGVALGSIVLVFSAADVQHSTLSPHAPWLLPIGGLALIAFIVRQRLAASPLIPRRALRQRQAWGALVISLFVGIALIAAVVDIPLFARATVHPDSQMDAAFVLVQFLIALPIGAVIGGYLTRWLPAGIITAAGMALCAIGFWRMSEWGAESLLHTSSSVVLVITGLGFGLAIAPVNASLLDHTQQSIHGMASGLLIVARMVGMLVGISVLTAVGMRRYYASQDSVPTMDEVCGPTGGSCQAYRDLLIDNALLQLQSIFFSAALCALVAGLLALALLGVRRSRPIAAR